MEQLVIEALKKSYSAAITQKIQTAGFSNIKDIKLDLDSDKPITDFQCSAKKNELNYDFIGTVNISPTGLGIEVKIQDPILIEEN
jgi:hypothetical protein